MSDDLGTERAGRHSLVCPAEHAGWLTIPGRRLVTNPTRILKGLVEAGGTAIDLGCGPGFFTLPLAEMVGEAGRVIAVDLQPAMLEKMTARAAAKGVSARITVHLSTTDSLGLDGQRADGALAFWMVHEVPDQARFFTEVHAALKPGARLLVVEPRGHVGAELFASMIGLARAAGFAAAAAPRVFYSRTVLLTRS